MDIHGIPINSLWTFVAWLPKFLLVRYFPKERLADLIYVDVRPRHESTTVNLGEVASFDIWLDALNLSPFEVELDRASFRFNCAGVNIPVSNIKRMTIAPGQTISLHLSSPISDGMANHISRHYQNNDSSLDVHMEFNCKLHAFCKENHLSGIKPCFLNANQRLPSVAKATA
jgi:hypothetical protein